MIFKNSPQPSLVVGIKISLWYLYKTRPGEITIPEAAFSCRQIPPG